MEFKKIDIIGLLAGTFCIGSAVLFLFDINKSALELLFSGIILYTIWFFWNKDK